MVFFLPNISGNYYLIIFTAAILAVTPVATAQPIEITTLRQSVDYALHNNRLLAADGSSVEQARAGQDEAQGHFMPRVDLSAGAVRTDAPGSYFATRLNQQKISAADFNPSFLNNPGYINNYQTRLNVTMPIYQGGALWAGKKQADHQLEAAELSHDYMRQQLIYQTITAYVRSRQSYAAIHAMETAVKAAKKRYEDTRALQKRGVLIVSDVMDARVHLLRTRLKLREAGNRHAQAIDILQQVMGVDSTVALVADAEPQLTALQVTLQQATKRALLSRPDLKGLEQAYQASLAKVDYDKAAFLPHVNLVAGQEWNSSTLALKHRNSMIAAQVTLNLFSGGSDRARVRSSQARRVAMALKIGDYKQKIRNDVAQAWRMLDEAKAREESEHEALRQSEESLRIKSLRYKQGLSRTSDLLDAQLQVDTTRLSSIRARFDVTAAQAALQLAVGTLNVGVIR